MSLCGQLNLIGLQTGLLLRNPNFLAGLLDFDLDLTLKT